MAAAMVGGLCASIVLFVMKKTMHHEKLAVEKKKYKFFTVDVSGPTVKWKQHDPDWR